MKSKRLIPFILLTLTIVFAWLLFFDYGKAIFSIGKIFNKQEASQLSEILPKANRDSAEFPYYGDNIGTITITSADIKADIYQGDDEDILDKGVGHSLASNLPGEGKPVVLSAHRTTNFSTLGQAKVGDSVKLDLYYGKYEYEIKKTKIFDMDDTGIISRAKGDILIVYTCYPFNYVGSAKQRYAVICSPTKGEYIRWK